METECLQKPMADAAMTLSVFQVFSGEKTIYTNEEEAKQCGPPPTQKQPDQVFILWNTSTCSGP